MNDSIDRDAYDCRCVVALFDQSNRARTTSPTSRMRWRCAWRPLHTNCSAPLSIGCLSEKKRCERARRPLGTAANRRASRLRALLAHSIWRACARARLRRCDAEGKRVPIDDFLIDTSLFVQERPGVVPDSPQEPEACDLVSHTLSHSHFA